MSHPPSVDRLARSQRASGLPHPLLVEEARRAIEANDVGHFADRVAQRKRSMLVPVINATGVLLHTNLGRAPLEARFDETYSNLELSLESGKRGSRQEAVGSSIAAAIGAESAMVVNNGASAVLLVLAALCAGNTATGNGVAVSRGEMVEIGGGFRVPDVMAQSGARLVEVGTTNRTRFDDFKRVVESGDVGLVMTIHQSNYKIVGFTESTSISELATLGVPVVADIGSGLLDAATPWLDGAPPAWLANEPAARQTLEQGANLVIFSGDKLFGSAQAGIIAGDEALVARCRQHPLARAVRPGSLVLQAIQSTTISYLERKGNDIAFWRMATLSNSSLRERAAEYPDGLDVVETKAVPGGGTLPQVTIPSIGLRLAGDHLDALRANDPPIIARVEDNATIVDLRTIAPEQDTVVAAALSLILDA